MMMISRRSREDGISRQVSDSFHECRAHIPCFQGCVIKQVFARGRDGASASARFARG
jgi:hypothetical protein